MTTSEEGVLEWLENLYKELLNLVEENKGWCAEVFPLENPDTVMCIVLTGKAVLARIVHLTTPPLFPFKKFD